MATTYLDITNEVLRELNEVPLTSANFTNATGIQKFVKDSINKSIFDIANEEPQLPFFSAGVSGGTDPFYGNVTVATVAGTRWYTLKADSSSITTDYASVDWDDFYLTTINVSGETTPYVSKGLKFLTDFKTTDEMFKRSKRKYIEGSIKTARRKYVDDQIALLKRQPTPDELLKFKNQILQKHPSLISIKYITYLITPIFMVG